LLIIQRVNAAICIGGTNARLTKPGSALAVGPANFTRRAFIRYCARDAAAFATTQAIANAKTAVEIIATFGAINIRAYRAFYALVVVLAGLANGY